LVLFVGIGWAVFLILDMITVTSNQSTSDTNVLADKNGHKSGSALSADYGFSPQFRRSTKGAK
jgi:hypothetical protein